MLFTPPPEVIQIVGNRVLTRIAFEEVQERSCKTLAQVRNEIHLKSNFPSGLITRKIRQRMTRIVDVWLKAMHYSPVNANYFKEHKPVFVTLTLPAKQIHTDQELHARALKRFIESMQRSHHVCYYLWRAERQCNGNIHYHILMDRFISHQLVRSTWVSIMNALGYIEAYRENQQQYHKDGFRVREDLIDKWSAIDQGKAYAEGMRTNWGSPNCTDVHGLRSVDDVTSYICKYVTKDDEYKEYLMLKRCHTTGEISDEVYAELEQQMLAVLATKKINGRCWGCSDELRTLKEPRLIVSTKEDLFIDDIAADPDTKIISGDTYKIFYVRNIKQILQRHKSISRILANHYRSCYNWLYRSPLEFIFEPDPPDILRSSVSPYKLSLQLDLYHDN